MSYQKQGFTDDETLYAYQMEKIEDGILDAEKSAEEAKAAASAAAPVYDLAAMGMSAIDMTGGSAYIETDTTELFAALSKGAVTFGLPLSFEGSTLTGYITMHSFTDNESIHQCVGVFLLTNYPTYIMVNVEEGVIMAAAYPYTLFTGLPAVSAEDNGKLLRVVEGAWAAAEEDAEAPPATVDLSAYESDGVIIETYADGSTLTYTMEFDESGNPIKITDSNGNVTVLTW